MIADNDWIVVTVFESGNAKHVRRSAVISFGAWPLGEGSYIDLSGHAIRVNETEADLALLLRIP
jgi:hypothetical protein